MHRCQRSVLHKYWWRGINLYGQTFPMEFLFIFVTHDNCKDHLTVPFERKIEPTRLVSCFIALDEGERGGA